MVEAYTTKEAVNYCTRYIQGGRETGMPIPQHEGRTLGMGCMGRKVRTDVQYEMVQEAHHSVLNQLVVMEPYVDNVAEPPNLMPPRSTYLPLDTKYSRKNTKLRCSVGHTPRENPKIHFFIRITI